MPYRTYIPQYLPDPLPEQPVGRRTRRRSARLAKVASEPTLGKGPCEVPLTRQRSASMPSVHVVEQAQPIMGQTVVEDDEVVDSASPAFTFSFSSDSYQASSSSSSWSPAFDTDECETIIPSPRTSSLSTLTRVSSAFSLTDHDSFTVGDDSTACAELWRELESRLGQRISVLDSYNPWSFLVNPLTVDQRESTINVTAEDDPHLVKTPPLRYRKKSPRVQTQPTAGPGLVRATDMSRIDTQILAVRAALRESDRRDAERMLARSATSMFRAATGGTVQSTSLGLEIDVRDPEPGLPLGESAAMEEADSSISSADERSTRDTYIPALEMVDKRLWLTTAPPLPKPSSLPQLKRAQRPPPLDLASRPPSRILRSPRSKASPMSARQSRIPVRTPSASTMLTTPSTGSRSTTSESTSGTSDATTPSVTSRRKSLHRSTSTTSSCPPASSGRRLKHRSTTGDLRGSRHFSDAPPLPTSRSVSATLEPSRPCRASGDSPPRGMTRGRSLTTSSTSTAAATVRLGRMSLKPTSAYAAHELPWIRGGGGGGGSVKSAPNSPSLPSDAVFPDPPPASAPPGRTLMSRPSLPTLAQPRPAAYLATAAAFQRSSSASSASTTMTATTSTTMAPIPPGLHRQTRPPLPPPSMPLPSPPSSVDRSRTLAERKFCRHDEGHVDGGGAKKSAGQGGRKHGFKMLFKKHKPVAIPVADRPTVPPTMSFFED